MKTRSGNYSENRPTVNGLLIKPAKTSEHGVENALPIPVDLVFEIFSRLPMKSIARCRCVSKIWASMLNRREFTELFMRKSSARPQLLFACEKEKELLIFSSPQPQNPDENSAPLIASHHMSFSFDNDDDYKISGVVDGLVCVTTTSNSDGWKETVPVICNTITGKSLPLKKVETGGFTRNRIMFGYEPIDKGFKVLCMTWFSMGIRHPIMEHQFLTLVTDEWRMVQGFRPGKQHLLSYLYNELCVNGVLYGQGENAICCFNLRSEKFSFIKVNETICDSTLINYGGNLGLLWSKTEDGHFHPYFDERSISLKLWVLEDVKRQEWSKRDLMLPPLWKDVVGEHTLNVVGVTGTNEIVFNSLPDSLYLFYLNTNKNTIIRVEIQGVELNEYDRIDIFMNHVEDLKLI